MRRTIATAALCLLATLPVALTVSSTTAAGTARPYTCCTL
jgi:hypothetical protein